jgi:protoporphyrinogen oxidase
LPKEIVIIGAGPTGLGAGWRLRELGHDRFHIYERNPYAGGLASSFTDDSGFTWDIGGHVMFSHYAYYDGVFAELMDHEYQLNTRESWVRSGQTWVPYPFQNNIRYLPADLCLECLLGLIRAQSLPQPRSYESYLDFMRRVFGDGICRVFMEPYNFKVWAHAPAMLSTGWLGERVAVVDVERAIRNVVLHKDDFGWGPNSQFKFPLYGGTGEFYRRMAESLDEHISLDARVDAIDLAAKRVRLQDGQWRPYDVLVSTMPLDVLVRLLGEQAPSEIQRASELLCHSGGHMVGVGIRRKCPSTRSWMYFPDGNCPFYRVTYLSNYSPNMTPDNRAYYSLLCETSYSPYKKVAAADIVDRTVDGLVNCGLVQPEEKRDIVSLWHFHADYSYPVPTLHRDEALKTIIPYLETFDVYSRGRFGIWKYEVSNTDHTLMQGVELVNRLLLGEDETSIRMQYETEKASRLGG